MWPYPQFPADLVTLTEEILNGKFFVQRKTIPFSRTPVNHIVEQNRWINQIKIKDNF